MSSSSRSGDKRLGQVDRGIAVAGGADELGAVGLGQQQLQPFGRQRLVVGNQDPQRLALSHSISTGMVSATLYPPPVIGPNRQLERDRRTGRRAAGRHWRGRGRFLHAWPPEARRLPPFFRRLLISSAHSPVEGRLGRDSDDHRLAALRHAIFDRILDDRLEDQRRKPRLLELVRERRSRHAGGRESAPSRCRDRAAAGRSPRPG